MNQNDHMQWRRLGFVAMVVVLAGCTNDGESGAPNTAPIREETTTAVVATEAPTTSTSAPVTTAVVSSSVAPVDSVPKPVGEDYRVPVVVKFVPSTDAEREVLAAATELLVKYRMLQLRVSSENSQLRMVLTGAALDEFIKAVAQSQNDVTVPSESDRVVVEAIETRTDSQNAALKVCEVDGSSVFAQSDNGDLVFDNAVLATLRKTYQLRRGTDGWRIAVAEVTALSEGSDQCADS